MIRRLVVAMGVTLVGSLLAGNVHAAPQRPSGPQVRMNRTAQAGKRAVQATQQGVQAMQRRLTQMLATRRPVTLGGRPVAFPKFRPNPNLLNLQNTPRFVAMKERIVTWFTSPKPFTPSQSMLRAGIKAPRPRVSTAPTI